MPAPPIVLALALAAPAVGTGSIAGAVHTVDGTPLRGVRVDIAVAGTPATRRTYSDHEGRYVLTGLAPATYRVSAAAPGLATLVSDGVQVAPAAVATVDLTMAVALVVVRVRILYKAPKVSTKASWPEELNLDFVSSPDGWWRTRDRIHYKEEAK